MCLQHRVSVLSVDESTDVVDIVQLCIWVRFPKENAFQEEMLCLLPLLGQTRGEHILNALLIFFNEKKLSCKLVAIVSCKCVHGWRTRHARQGEGAHRSHEEKRGYS